MNKIVYDINTGVILAIVGPDQDAEIVADNYDNSKVLKTNINIELPWEYQVDLDTETVIEK